MESAVAFINFTTVNITRNFDILNIYSIVAEVIIAHFVLQQQKLLVDFVVAAELELARVVVSVLGPDLAFAAAPALVHGSE